MSQKRASGGSVDYPSTRRINDQAKGDTPVSNFNYILVVNWSGDDMPGLPRYVGPFDTPDEAQSWAELNAARAMYSVQPLGYPYMRAGDGSHVYIAFTRRPDPEGDNHAGI